MLNPEQLMKKALQVIWLIWWSSQSITRSCLHTELGNSHFIVWWRTRRHKYDYCLKPGLSSSLDSSSPLKCNTKHEAKLMLIVLNSERALQEERDLDMLLAVFCNVSPTLSRTKSNVRHQGFWADLTLYEQWQLAACNSQTCSWILEIYWIGNLHLQIGMLLPKSDEISHPEKNKFLGMQACKLRVIEESEEK